MSLQTVRYLHCDFCTRRGIRLEGDDVSGDWIPEDWREVAYSLDKPGHATHACPECGKYMDEHGGKPPPYVPRPFHVPVLTSGLPTPGLPAPDFPTPDFPTPDFPKISETPHVPTTHGCERFVTGEVADNTGDA